jgi:hypothetical protein
LAILLSACGIFTLRAARSEIPALTHVQTDYAQNCGGCHGIQGISAVELVPPLKDRVGFFLCTPAARRYIVQLPDVAFAALSDAELAAVMNFVAFDLGGPSAPKAAKPYTVAEVSQLRVDTPLRSDLRLRRRSIVAEVGKACRTSTEIAKPNKGY